MGGSKGPSEPLRRGGAGERWDVAGGMARVSVRRQNRCKQTKRQPGTFAGKVIGPLASKRRFSGGLDSRAFRRGPHGDERGSSNHVQWGC